MIHNYVCACCGENGQSETTDEELLKELHENFGEVPLEDCDEVCDACYIKIMKFINKD